MRIFQHKRKNCECFADLIMRRPTGAFFTLLVLFILCVPGILCASSLKISWNPNTESDLGGYRIYYGNASRNYSHALNVGNTTSVTIDGFFEGYTYYLAVTAYDYSGNESSFSQEVSVAVPGTDGASVLSTILGWLHGIIGDPFGSGISQYSLSNFSSVRTGDIVETVRVVRLGISGGAGPAVPVGAGTTGPDNYPIRDVVAEVGYPLDLFSLYPQGTYFFLPLTTGSAFIDNDRFYSWEPGVHLYMVTDITGELIHILRVSVLDIITLFSECTSGEGMLLQDPDTGISLQLPDQALEGDFPICLGWTSSSLNGSSAVFVDTSRVREFAIAPFGLVLSEPAEVSAPYGGPGEPVVERFDESEMRWVPIEGARVEGGLVVFSTQSLGRFKVYPEPGAQGDSSSGGGCFISSCAL